MMRSYWNIGKPQVLVLVFSLVLLSCVGQTSGNKIDQHRDGIGTSVSAMGERIFVVFQDSRRHYWFAGGAEGAYRYDQKSLVLFSTDDGLPSNAIFSIQEDKQGNLYFDTPSGVSRFDGRSFETLPVADSQESVWRLEPDDLWFRMDVNGVGPYRYDGQVLHALTFPKPEQAFEHEARHPNVSYSPFGIYNIYRDRQGVMWFGTASLGVCRYDGQTISWLYEEKMTITPAGGSLGIRATLEDKEGHFWFTNTRYRYEISPDHVERGGVHYLNYTKRPGVGHDGEQGEVTYPYFMSIAEDRQGHLWMVTYDEGVWRNDGEKLIHYPIKDGEQNMLLFSIYADREGALWLGTHHNGVLRFNGETFEPLKP